MTPEKETRFLVEVLTLAVGVTQIGQFLIILTDPSLTFIQQMMAIICGIGLFIIFGAAFYILHIKK